MLDNETQRSSFENHRSEKSAHQSSLDGILLFRIDWCLSISRVFVLQFNCFFFVYPRLTSAMCNSIMFTSNVEEEKFFSHRLIRWSDKTLFAEHASASVKKTSTVHIPPLLMSIKMKQNHFVEVDQKRNFVWSFFCDLFSFWRKKKEKRMNPIRSCRHSMCRFSLLRTGIVSAICLLVLSSASMHTLLVLLLRVACLNFFERRDVYNDLCGALTWKINRRW